MSTSTPDTEVLVAYGTQPFAYTYAYRPPTKATPQHYTIRLVLHYRAILSLQQGRYRYEVTDFDFEYPTAKPSSLTRLPAEDNLIHTRPINERGASMLTAERTRFEETVTKLLAQLQQQMSTPANPTGVE